MHASPVATCLVLPEEVGPCGGLGGDEPGPRGCQPPPPQSAPAQCPWLHSVFFPSFSFELGFCPLRDPRLVCLLLESQLSRMSCLVHLLRLELVGMREVPWLLASGVGMQHRGVQAVLSSPNNLPFTDRA